MGRNIQSDGTAEDLIRSFVQIGCAEVHAKTLVEKYNAQLENLADDFAKVEELGEKIQSTTDEMNNLAELRREIMLNLFSMYDGDKDWWCMVKHIGIGAYTLFEAYQASDDDPELYNLYIEANKRFVFAMTHFLGVEITECAACFADAIKKGDHNDVSV